MASPLSRALPGSWAKRGGLPLWGGSPRGFAAVLAVLLSVAALRSAPLRVWIIAGPGLPAEEVKATLAAADGADCSVTTLPVAGAAVLSGLGLADVGVLWVRGRPAGSQGLAALRDFLAAGKGLVVLGEKGGTWSDWLGFDAEVAGASYGAPFAGGERMRVINALPHAITTGVRNFDPAEAMRECRLAGDAGVFLEGMVGENTVPLGWMRKSGRGRVVCLQPGNPELWGDADYRRLVANSVDWAAARPIPGAKTLLQRTYLNQAYPGAIAITFPQGPSLCYDIVRGGINYVSDGDFADLHPWWTGRHGAPIRDFGARISGDVFYRENTLAPGTHLGSGTADSAYHYHGYRMKGLYPELSYTVDDREVREELRPTADAAGVVRIFRLQPGKTPFWLKIEPGEESSVMVEGAVWEGGFIHFDGTGRGEFTVTIHRKGAPAR